MEPNPQSKQASKVKSDTWKERTNSQWPEGEGRLTGERRGRVESRNMYKGPMDKDNKVGGRTECGR